MLGSDTLGSKVLGSALTYGSIIYPVGIASSEAFGNAKLNLNILASGIQSSEAFGTAKLNLNVLASGIASVEAFGDVTVIVKPLPDLGSGIYGNYLYGNVETQELISSVLYILVSGIASSEAFGNAKLNLNVLASGIASSEAFGNATVNIYGIQDITNAGNISSLEAFGNPHVTIPEKVNYDWIPYIIVRLNTEDSIMCRVGGIKGNA